MKTLSPKTIIIVALLLLPFGSAAQRGKATKKTSSAAAKIYSMSAAQSQITLTLTQEGALQKIHPLHHVAAQYHHWPEQAPPPKSHRPTDG